MQMYTPLIAGHYHAANLKRDLKSEILIVSYSSVSKDIIPVSSCTVTIKSNDVTVFDGEIEELIALLRMR
jgi:hypothetical protein